MIKRSSSPAGLVFLIALATSCTYQLYVDKTYDPEISIEKKMYRIVFVNLFDYTLEQEVSERKEIPFRNGILKLAEGLSTSLTAAKGFEYIPGDTLRKDVTSGSRTAVLTSDTVTAICRRCNADLLLTHDSADIYFTWETLRDEENAKTKNFYLWTNFYVSLYSANGELINRSKLENGVLYTSRMALSGIITITPSFAKATNSVETLAFKAGSGYVNKFFPETIQELRVLYAGKEFAESIGYIKSGNYDKAIVLLEQLTASPKRSTAAKARHNLDIVREMMPAEQKSYIPIQYNKELKFY